MLNLFLLRFSILISLFSNRLCIFKLFSQFELIFEFDLIGLELCFFCLQSLLLLEEFLVLDADDVALVGPFSGEGGELILQDFHFCSEVGDCFVL